MQYWIDRMKLITVSLFSALLTTLSIETYNYFRGFDEFSISRITTIFLMTFIIIYSTVYFSRKKSEWYSSYISSIAIQTKSKHPYWVFEEAAKEIYSIIVFGFIFFYVWRNKSVWLHKHYSTLSRSIIAIKKVLFYFILYLSGFFLFVSVFDLFVVIHVHFLR